MPGLPFALRALGKLQSILLLKWHSFGMTHGTRCAGSAECRRHEKQTGVTRFGQSKWVTICSGLSNLMSEL